MDVLVGVGRGELGLRNALAWETWRPDPSPTPAPPLLVPRGPDDLAAHYDLTVSLPAAGLESFAAFERWLAQAASRRGLTCALLHDGVVPEAIRRLSDGRLTVHFHLDYFALWHVADDPYARLAQAVQDAGGRTVNPPARSRLFTDKAAAHAELKRLGLGVPETVLFRPWMPDRPLTPAERGRLRLDEPGARAYLKPANGFGRRGVVRVDRPDPAGLAVALAYARNFDRHDTFLLQREVRCPRLADADGAERPAYWRVFYCLGELIPFWWSPAEPEQRRPSYWPLSLREVRRHGLGPVLAAVRVLADLSGLDWFSTELCLSDGPEPSRFKVRGRPVVAIDYWNDQCDVDVQSRWPGAAPDGVVAYVAERFAAAAAGVRSEECSEPEA
jgi:hypothetical protein